MSPWLLVVFLTSHSLLLTQQVNALEQLPGFDDGSLPFPLAALWSSTLAQFVLLFLVLGPLVMLGAAVVRRWVPFEMPRLAYLKACAVAATPASVISVVRLLPEGSYPEWLGAVLVVLVAFYVLWHSFGLTVVRGLLVFAAAAPLFVGGLFLCQWMVADQLLDFVFAVGPAAVHVNLVEPGVVIDDNFRARVQVTATRQLAFRDAIADTEQKILGYTERVLGKDVASRDEMLPAMNECRKEVEGIMSMYGGGPGWERTLRALERLNTLVMALPATRAGPGPAKSPPAAGTIRPA